MSAEVWLDANLVHLQTAVLCANCDVISDGQNGHCASCGGQSLLHLSRILGGTIAAEVAAGVAVSADAVSDKQVVRSLSAAA